MKIQLQAMRNGLYTLAVLASLAVYAAPPKIVLSVSGPDPRLTVHSDSGVTNQIQYATQLGSSVEWNVLTNLWVIDTNYTFVDPTAAGAGSRFYRIQVLTNAAAVQNPAAGMTTVPAGSFVMGDTIDGIGDATPHTVTLGAFQIETNLVSYTLWKQIYQWATAHGYSFGAAGAGKAADHPVQSISWNDAVKWCNARSELEGLTPCYYTDNARTTIYKIGNNNLSAANVNWSANGYRLPTEAEWEKAARGGVEGLRFPTTMKISENIANYAANTLAYAAYDLGPTGYNKTYANGGVPYTNPVGVFPPNGYGLYDMAGNVREWCWDWYDSIYYKSSPDTDPQGPAAGSYRVVRGGSWDSLAPAVRTADRSSSGPTHGANVTGFRCVRGF